MSALSIKTICISLSCLTVAAAPLRAYGSTLSEATSDAAVSAAVEAEARRFLVERLGSRWCAVSTPLPAVEVLRHAPDGAHRGSISALRPAREPGGPDEELTVEPQLGHSAHVRWRLLVLKDGSDAASCEAALATAWAPPPAAEEAAAVTLEEAELASSASKSAATKPFDGSCKSLPACASLPASAAAEEEHRISVMVGLNPDLDVGVVRHTWTRVNAAAQLRALPTTLRVMSFNLWNVNPPRWLWRNPADRLRQYAFRMYHAGDILRQTAPDVLALQEVRYESTLGGRGPAFEAGLARAEDWYNQTRSIAKNPRYVERNAHWWADVIASESFEPLVSRHPIESAPATTPDETPAAGAPASADDSAASLDGNSSASSLPPPPPPQSPYERGMARGPADFGRVRAAAARHPHAQVELVAAHLPGHQFVFRPAQMYLDAGRWLVEGEPHRDEEGPAIFSRHAIVHDDALLLSRDTRDEGDSHQRLCLHAVLDIGGGALVDVYTVHLALSERARNRTVQELAAYVRASARGGLQVLTGDFNAEPHEPAMRWLVGRLDSELSLADHTASPAEVAAAARSGTAPAPVSAAFASSPVKICALRDDLFERCPVDVEVVASANAGASGSAAAAAEVASDGGVVDAAAPAPAQHFVDSFALAYGDAVPEPQPGSPDASVRRYLFTFPSDNPVKRIDLVLLASPAGAGALRGNGSAPASSPPTAGALTATAASYFLLGQDALPGTEAYEGRGLGMTADRSPIYASDHRAVVLDLGLARA